MMTSFYVASTAPFHTILGSNWMLKRKKPKARNLGCRHGNVFFSAQLDLERPAWPMVNAVALFFGRRRGGGAAFFILGRQESDGARDSGSLVLRAG